MVEGVDDLMTHMASCCKPVPYDPIIGFITHGRGVTVHRKRCANIRKLSETERERLIEVSWSRQPADTTYPVDILVTAADRKGLLSDISSAISSEDVDVTGVQTHSDRTTDTASMSITLEISDIKHLSKLLNKVAQIPDVMEVRRRV
jgi:GTP pyrophosphokinase